MPTGFYKRSSEQIKRLKQIGFKKGNIQKHKFEKGNTLRKGIKLTDEQRRRISDGHIGLKKSEETKNKIRMAQIDKPRPQTRGEKNGNWQGGIAGLNSGRIKSARYKMWRREVFIRDSFTCQSCGEKNIYLEAHHIQGYSKFPELRFVISNGVTLCQACHKKTDNYANNGRKKI
jgi:hypothetical protein